MFVLPKRVEELISYMEMHRDVLRLLLNAI